jgi:hypothetical protein
MLLNAGAMPTLRGIAARRREMNIMRHELKHSMPVTMQKLDHFIK